MIFRKKEPTTVKWFKKGKIWENYLFRGEFNILGKILSKWSKKELWEFEYKKHIGKPILVTMSVFKTDKVNSLTNFKIVGRLVSVDVKSGYCEWTRQGVKQSCVHYSSIKLLK